MCYCRTRAHVLRCSQTGSQLYTRSYELFKAFSPSNTQGHSRLTLWIAYCIAQTYYESGKFDMAVRCAYVAHKAPQPSTDHYVHVPQVLRADSENVPQREMGISTSTATHGMVFMRAADGRHGTQRTVVIRDVGAWFVKSSHGKRNLLITMTRRNQNTAG